MKKIKQTLIKLILGAILICIAFMIFYNLYYFFRGWEDTDYLWKADDFIWVVAKDDMMSPQINKNDIISFKDCSDRDLKKGDIVYLKESGTKKIAKIENIKTDNLGTKYYTTKGENNLYYNKEDVTLKDIYGKYDKKVNFFGNILQIAKSKIFSFIIVAFILAILIISERNHKKSELRKKKRENRIYKNNKSSN